MQQTSLDLDTDRDAAVDLEMDPERMQRRGDRLGGHTGGYFLRFVGKDTPMFSRDVVKALVEQEVVDKEPTSKRDLAAAQTAFSRWREESGRDLCQISRVLACSVP